ncbi:MAG: DNA polymerase III [Deinococcales bacterium]
MIGHEHSKRDLAQTTANAVLLEGVARVGRKSLALWYAAWLNCKQPTELEPCGVCPSCQNIATQTHPDVLLVSPREETSTGKRARNSLIPIGMISRAHDTGRDFEQHVLEFIELAPHYRHKVVIFDGAQFLNESAANALLKSVEEPPHRARFVFIAEDASGVIPTIVSRSQRYRVAPVPDALLQTLLPSPDPELLAFAAGRVGLIQNLEPTKNALLAAQTFLQQIQLGLLEALSAADVLEKAYDRSLTPDALRFALRRLDAAVRIQADAALETAVQALERYATPSLVFSSLALEWRAAMGLGL